MATSGRANSLPVTGVPLTAGSLSSKMEKKNDTKRDKQKDTQLRRQKKTSFPFLLEYSSGM